VPPGNGCGWNWIIFPKGPSCFSALATQQLVFFNTMATAIIMPRCSLTCSAAGRQLGQPSLVDALTVDFAPLSRLTQVPTTFLYGQGDYPMITIYNELDIPTIPFGCPVLFGL
jgi:hypothetical protein